MKLMKSVLQYCIYCWVVSFFVACSPRVPSEYIREEVNVSIYPDYSGLVIPCNIAPLNFEIKSVADKYITRFKASDGQEIVVAGNTVKLSLKRWRKLLEANKGKSYSVEVFLQRDGKWYRQKPFSTTIAVEPIDEFLSYRLIEPGYMGYEVISINQRNLTNFREKEVYNNMMYSDNLTKSQCINCHSYQNYRTDNMQFHVRQFKGGTVIVNDGEAMKINLQSDSTVSAGVYPSWHPTEKLIAYSVNKIGQMFHSKNLEKVQVVDTRSDIILLDIEKKEIQHVVRDPNSLETWPHWSPDGKTLYFASARFTADTKKADQAAVENYNSVRYDLLSIPFDLKSRKFGQQDTIFSAARIGKSAALPRVSPDGKYLMFSLADYGNFHIWHKSSDIYLKDLTTGKVRPMQTINSAEVESYHSWSSNGRWIVFSTRRDDGSYTRPYIAYFDSNGREHKPFIVPQKDPEYYGQLFKSYNIPEFTIEEIPLSAHDFYKTISEDAVPVSYTSR